MLKRNELELSPVGSWYRDVSEWRRYVQEFTDLSVTDRFVACFIADRINRKRDDQMWYKQETMAEKIGVSTDTIHRAIRALERENLLKVTRGRRGLKSAVNKYELLYPWK